MAYQNTVILRVSQLEGVAVTALQRDRTPLKEANDWEFILGNDSRAGKSPKSFPRQNERRHEAAVSLNKKEMSG